MSRRVADDRLEALQIQLRAKKNHTGVNRWFSIDCRELSCIIDEIRQRRERPKQARYGKNTLAMMAMQVGDVIILPPTAQSALTTSRESARKALNAPDARWHCEEQPGGHIRCERRPDGSPHQYGRARNPAIAEMAKMQVGDSIVIKGKMYARLRIMARQEMGSPAAKWRSESLANGSTRLKRIA